MKFYDYVFAAATTAGTLSLYQGVLEVMGNQWLAFGIAASTWAAINALVRQPGEGDSD